MGLTTNLAVAVGAAMFAAAAHAGVAHAGAADQAAAKDIRTEKVVYQHGGRPMEGVAVYDAAVEDDRPAVLVVHDWNGIDDYEIGRARMLAELGYVAFCVDVYGQGVRPKTPAECSAEASKYYQDNALFRGRLQAGLEALTARPGVDATRVAAIGYCFGGTAVVELARSGAPVAGVASFHGGLAPRADGEVPQIRGKVIVFHAIDDPVVPRANFYGWLDEMVKNKVDVQAVVYNLATHSFTVPGGSYDVAADRRSWATLREFLGEVAPLR